MKRLSFYALLILIGACGKTDDPPVEKAPDFEGYTLVWSDEFNDDAINANNWVHELGDGTAYGLPPGWGNNELQLYTDAAENASIEKDANNVSALVIAATEDGPGNYRSAKLTTQGLQHFRYGKIDARIKLPTAQGMWPAFWMLGENRTEVDWPGCGEVDIVELVGSAPNRIQSNVHYTNGDKEYSNDEGSPVILDETLDQNYHNFTIDWTPTEITFSLDGAVYKTTAIADDMKEFQRSFYLILNVAVGGDWPGPPDASTTFPQKMYVDYVRYYSKDGFTAPDPPVLDIDEETVGVLIPQSLAQHAFNSTLGQFPDVEIMVFGAGGEPFISSTDVVVEGDSALLFSFPGGNWGGGWFEMIETLDMSAYATGNLVFSIQKPVDLNDAEIKLESATNSASVFLIDYTPTAVANDYMEYIIPIADFTDLDLTTIRIPFALWNPMDATGAFIAFDVLVDNIYWAQ
jgi:beta-glucanase (GH16 family)